MYYAIYKDVRNSSWQCLLDFKLTKLPIDILKITRLAGIKVIRNSIVDDLLPGENGKAYFDGKWWRIIYNDLNSTELSRFTIAHELGHIFLGHELTHKKSLPKQNSKGSNICRMKENMWMPEILSILKKAN